MLSPPAMLLSTEEAAALSAAIEAAFHASGEDGVLQVMLPNGKTFAECNADELREISRAYNGLAARNALTPNGLVAQKFFNGIYLEMAGARLGDLALRQTGRDFERAKPILRRLLAADPVILTHLLECALDDEVCAIVSTLMAKAGAQDHAGSQWGAPGTLAHVLQDGLASVHELAHSRQFGTPDLRGITHYELAAQCVLEEIQAVPSSRAGRMHAEPVAADATRTVLASFGPYEEMRSAAEPPVRLTSCLDAPEADTAIRRRGRDESRPEGAALS